LTLDALAAAAVAIADADGLPAVTTRSIAARLGVGAASLYRYIASKDDLFDLMVDAVASEYDLPAPSSDWRADLMLLATRSRALHRRHPWVLSLSSGASWGPNVRSYLDYLLAALAHTSMGSAEKFEVIGLVGSWSGQFGVLEAQQGADAADPGRIRSRLPYFAEIAADASRPHLAEAVTSLLRGQVGDLDLDELFTRAMERLFQALIEQY